MVCRIFVTSRPRVLGRGLNRVTQLNQYDYSRYYGLQYKTTTSDRTRVNVLSTVRYVRHTLWAWVTSRGGVYPPMDPCRSQPGLRTRPLRLSRENGHAAYLA